MKYTVKNIYNVAGESNHRTINAALKARDKREGLGWIVVDETGKTYDHDFNSRPVAID